MSTTGPLGVETAMIGVVCGGSVTAIAGESDLSPDCGVTEPTVVSLDTLKGVAAHTGDIGLSARGGAIAEEATICFAIGSDCAGRAVVATGVAATLLSCLANKAAVGRRDDSTSRGKATAAAEATGVVGAERAGCDDGAMGRIAAGVDGLDEAAVVAPNACARTSTLPAGDALRTGTEGTEMYAGGEVTLFGVGDCTTIGDVTVRKVSGVDGLEDTLVVVPND